MLNKILYFMIILSLTVSFFNRRYINVIEGGLKGAKESLYLMATLFCTMSFFNGILNIAKKSKITDLIKKKINGPVSFLFKNIGSEEKDYVSMNITLNMLGMGNVATPSGIKAIREMQKKNKRKERATFNMCLFVLINSASIQLIPTTVIGMRIANNSVNPGIIILPVLFSSFTGLTLSVILLYFLEKRRNL